MIKRKSTSKTMGFDMTRTLEEFLTPLVDVGIRFYVGQIFLRSGWLKFQNFLNDNWETTVALYRDIFPVPGLKPEIAAILGTSGELVLPIMLIAGLFTRLAAFGIFLMAFLINLTFKDMPEHYYWMFLMATLIARGGGMISLDNLVAKIRGVR